MQGRKPTMRERVLLMKRHLDPESWLVIKKPPGELHLKHRHTNTRRVLKGSLLNTELAD